MYPTAQTSFALIAVTPSSSSYNPASGLAIILQLPQLDGLAAAAVPPRRKRPTSTIANLQGNIVVFIKRFMIFSPNLFIAQLITAQASRCQPGFFINVFDRETTLKLPVQRVICM
jgi:hypothetical protein